MTLKEALFYQMIVAYVKNNCRKTTFTVSLTFWTIMRKCTLTAHSFDHPYERRFMLQSIFFLIGDRCLFVAIPGISAFNIIVTFLHHLETRTITTVSDSCFQNKWWCCCPFQKNHYATFQHIFGNRMFTHFLCIEGKLCKM